MLRISVVYYTQAMSENRTLYLAVDGNVVMVDFSRPLAFVLKPDPVEYEYWGAQRAPDNNVIPLRQDSKED